jgi:hypothetical protein
MLCIGPSQNVVIVQKDRARHVKEQHPETHRSEGSHAGSPKRRPLYLRCAPMSISYPDIFRIFRRVLWRHGRRSAAMRAFRRSITVRHASFGGSRGQPNPTCLL